MSIRARAEVRKRWPSWNNHLCLNQGSPGFTVINSMSGTSYRSRNKGENYASFHFSVVDKSPFYGSTRRRLVFS